MSCLLIGCKGDVLVGSIKVTVRCHFQRVHIEIPIVGDIFSGPLKIIVSDSMLSLQ